MNYNKLKRSVEKINMPEGMEERIIENCRKNPIQIKSSDKNEADFSQQVSGVDHIAPRSKIIRIISSVAACAVIAGCIGTTVHLMNRSSSPFYDGAESITPAVQPSFEDKNDKISFYEAVPDLRTLYNEQYIFTASYENAASYDKRKTFLDIYDLKLLDQFFKESSKDLLFASESDELDDLMNEFEGDTFIYAEKDGSAVSYSIGFKEDKVIVNFINSDTDKKQLVFNNETADHRINAIVSTIIKNGSLEDNINYYPPFGNLAKSTTEDIEISCFEGEKNTTAKAESRKLHRIFYGYDWNSCQINPTDMPESANKEAIYSFSMVSENINRKVAVFGDNYVMLNNIDGVDITETKQCYYIPNGSIGTDLKSLMSENS